MLDVGLVAVLTPHDRYIQLPSHALLLLFCLSNIYMVWIQSNCIFVHNRDNFLKLFMAVVGGDSSLAARLITDGQTHLSPETIRMWTHTALLPASSLLSLSLTHTLSDQSPILSTIILFLFSSLFFFSSYPLLFSSVLFKQTQKKNEERFGEGIDVLMREVNERPLAEVNMSKIFLNMMSLARHHRVYIDPNFTTLVIGTVIVRNPPSRPPSRPQTSKSSPSNNILFLTHTHTYTHVHTHTHTHIYIYW